MLHKVLRIISIFEHSLSFLVRIEKPNKQASKQESISIDYTVQQTYFARHDSEKEVEKCLCILQLQLSLSFYISWFISPANTDTDGTLMIQKTTKDSGFYNMLENKGNEMKKRKRRRRKREKDEKMKGKKQMYTKICKKTNWTEDVKIAPITKSINKGAITLDASPTKVEWNENPCALLIQSTKQSTREQKQMQ